MPKTWCRHITWNDLSDRSSGGGFAWWFVTKDKAVIVSKNWKVCPVCLAERPTRENVRAAELRFAMDNDQ
jgi:hypothetical protein